MTSIKEALEHLLGSKDFLREMLVRDTVLRCVQEYVGNRDEKGTAALIFIDILKGQTEWSWPDFSAGYLDAKAAKSQADKLYDAGIYPDMCLGFDTLDKDEWEEIEGVEEGSEPDELIYTQVMIHMDRGPMFLEGTFAIKDGEPVFVGPYVHDMAEKSIEEMGPVVEQILDLLAEVDSMRPALETLEEDVSKDPTPSSTEAIFH